MEAAVPRPTGGASLVEARDITTVSVGELAQALTGDRVTIMVVSAALLGDPWPRLSEVLATSAMIERDADVVPLVLEACTLPLHLEAKVRLDFCDRSLWDDEAQRLRDYLARPAPVEPELACPYPGMRPFQAADAVYFHGRRTEIDAVVGLVSGGAREIYLVGPSGSGKSSLIYAGVVPRLDWQRILRSSPLSKVAQTQATLATEATTGTANATTGTANATTDAINRAPR